MTDLENLEEVGILWAHPAPPRKSYGCFENPQGSFDAI